jgi:NAD(P)-dependent dehydrogenase (short-subunit alcohol dehydrogenase family)
MRRMAANVETRRSGTVEGPRLDGWALILGASSGFGAATARHLASRGMDVIGVHLDRRNTVPMAEAVQSDITSHGRRAEFFNVNAADAEARKRVLDQVTPAVKGSQPPIRVMLHSLAFGTLKPYIGDAPDEAISQRQMEMTLDVMANSLAYWAQDLAHRDLLDEGSRIYAMTSAGSERVWPTYGAVGTAKSTLEAHIRQLAVELAPRGVTANAIRAGVTDTPALRAIPGNDQMLAHARRFNPSGRLTTPEDVAQAISALVVPETAWLTGTVLNVDGGELLTM